MRMFCWIFTGTVLNGKRLAKGSRERIADGDKILIAACPQAFCVSRRSPGKGPQNSPPRMTHKADLTSYDFILCPYQKCVKCSGIDLWVRGGPLGVDLSARFRSSS